MKNRYKKTLSVLKKSDMIMSYFANDRVILSNGHVLFEFRPNIYREYIGGTHDGLPALTDNLVNNGYVWDKVRKSDGLKPADNEILKNYVNDYLDRADLFVDPVSPMMFDLGSNKLVRTIVYNDGGCARGVMISDNYYQALREFMTVSDKVYHSNYKSPVVAVASDDVRALVLPINPGKESEFNHILDTLTAEAEMKRQKTEKKFRVV